MNKKVVSKKSNITFIIFTYNEEKRIKYPIKCFLPYGDVIISDDSSTDKTVKIAIKLGVRVIKRKTHLPFVENNEEAKFIFSHVNTDWVFWGFADEMVPKTCLRLFKKISSGSKYKIVVQKRKTLLYDSKSEFVPCDVSINFFRKDSIDFSKNTIHQMGKFALHVKPTEVLYLPPIDEYSVYHFSLYDTESQIRNFNIYSSIDERASSNKFISLKIFTLPILTFLNIYIFLGAFRNGVKGLIVSIQFAIYSFLTLAKTYEKNENISLKVIEKKFIPLKKFILKQSPKTNFTRRLFAHFKIALISSMHKFYKFSQINRI